MGCVSRRTTAALARWGSSSGVEFPPVNERDEPMPQPPGDVASVAESQPAHQVHAVGGMGYSTRAGATKYGREAYPLRKSIRTRQGVRAPAGVTGDGEFFQAELICQLEHIRRPVEDPATRLKSGFAVTGAVKGDQTNAHLPGDLIVWMKKTRARHPMEKEKRFAARITHIVNPEAASIMEEKFYSLTFSLVNDPASNIACWRSLMGKRLFKGLQRAPNAVGS